MSEEKTEAPTPKKLRDAKRKGNVAQSSDLVGLIGLGAALLVILSVIGAAGPAFEAYTAAALRTAAAPGDASFALVLVALTREGAELLIYAVAIGAAAAIAGGMASFLQVGAVIAFEPLTPKFDKLNPITGLKNKFFSMRAYVELLKTIAKIAIIGIVASWVIWRERLALLGASLEPAEALAPLAWRVILPLLLYTLLAYAAVGAADLVFQRWQHTKDLKMSKKEVKDEYKQQEGDPHTKSRRKQMHEELSTQSMLQAARKADVIVTNPTHIACALRYDPEQEQAPRLLAKGRGHVADQLREIAREEGIPMIRDVSLAHALHALELDEEIPEELYDAVAVVLNWVAEAAAARGQAPAWVRADGRDHDADAGGPAE